jgi:hypothetical protein
VVVPLLQQDPRDQKTAVHKKEPHTVMRDAKENQEVADQNRCDSECP